jgi:[ribosomal protein S18]-alanine N-acetyltransferase
MSGALNLTELRAGGVQDLQAVNTIMQDAFDSRFGEAWTKSQCMGMLSLPGVWLTLASVADRDVGFALARSTGLEAELLLLATGVRARGRGVGGALLRAVISEAEGRGVKDLHLEVRAGNEAIRLYSREGFVKVGERRNYYRGNGGQLFDAQTFARKL